MQQQLIINPLITLCNTLYDQRLLIVQCSVNASIQNNILSFETTSLFIIHQIFLLVHDWSKHVTWANIPQLKLGNIQAIFPNFRNQVLCEKYLKDNKHNNLHLGRKYPRIFVIGHYLFLVAHSFPRATLSENCLLLGTDNVCGQISQHIFVPNGGYCLYIFAPNGGYCLYRQ